MFFLSSFQFLTFQIGGAVSGYDVPTCVTPTLLIQELNDQNLLRHNQLTSSSTFSDRMSSTDSSSTRNRAKPPPPQRSLGIESNKTTYAKNGFSDNRPYEAVDNFPCSVVMGFSKRCLKQAS